MLHVKHGDMLVDRDLEPLRRRGLQERFELREVQIVRGRDALQAELVLEIIRRQPVGDVERVIANAPLVREEGQMVVVADEVAVRLAGADLLERPLLAHLEDPRRSDKELRSAECGVRSCGTVSHRLAILLRVLELAVKRLHATLQGGVELLKVTHQHDQVRSAERGVRS